MEAPPPSDPYLGRLVGGRYELRDLLAKGAQGAIYRARDRETGADVAVKTQRNALSDPDAAERLRHEAAALRTLSGTAAVELLAELEDDAYGVAIAMELLHGRDLGEELAELEAAGERMPLARVRALFEPIVHTLEAARTHDIVHRDVKPENVFVLHPAYGGGVRLLDFGFARFTRKRRITAQGMVAGSPTHIAPEVWRGEGDVDHRADVYGLAVVLFRVLGGQVPFPGDDLLKLMRAVIGAKRPSLHALRPDLDPSIDAWAAQALAIDREARFSRVTAAWNALWSTLETASSRETGSTPKTASTPSGR